MARDPPFVELGIDDQTVPKALKKVKYETGNAVEKAEQNKVESACPHRIRPVRTLLENQRDNLLAFAVELDRDLTTLAQEWQISVTIAREVLQVLSLPTWDPKRCRREAALRETLRGRYHGMCADVQELSNQVVRASSMVENLNSRLRSYFFLRRQLGKDYLTLLQFFLNHRRYLPVKTPVESARVLPSC